MLHAHLYAAIHRGNPGDIAFYRRFCRGAGGVLELGVGSGRVARALAEHVVTGIDRDREMLALAADVPHLTTIEADMADFALPLRFDRVIAPYHALCCLLTPAALTACFGSVARHLQNDGAFAFDIYRGEPGFVDDGEDFLVEVELDGVSWQVFERAIAHPDPARADTAYRFVSESDEVTLTLEQRLIDDAEIFTALADAGLVVRSVHGGFAEEPLEVDSPQLVVTAAPGAPCQTSA